MLCSFIKIFSCIDNRLAGKFCLLVSSKIEEEKLKLRFFVYIACIFVSFIRPINTNVSWKSVLNIFTLENSVDLRSVFQVITERHWRACERKERRHIQI